jgi:hypothetical protein
MLMRSGITKQVLKLRLSHAIYPVWLENHAYIFPVPCTMSLPMEIGVSGYSVMKKTTSSI